MVRSLDEVRADLAEIQDRLASRSVGARRAEVWPVAPRRTRTRMSRGTEGEARISELRRRLEES